MREPKPRRFAAFKVWVRVPGDSEWRGFLTAKDAARELGVSAGIVRLVCRGVQRGGAFEGTCVDPAIESDEARAARFALFRESESARRSARRLIARLTHAKDP